MTLPNPELQDGVRDEGHHENADADCRNENKKEQLLRRLLARRDRVRAHPPSKKYNQENERNGRQARPAEARHRLPKPAFL